ncbi:MAG: hypothetical protein SCH66_02885 [Methanolobus sp.]|nr:hypothetical protein [Methanolobus sp.]
MMAARKLRIPRNMIILIFFLSILSSSAHAYDFHDENIWIFKGMYELGAGERAEIEGYTVKVHTIDTNNSEPTAILLVYINREFKESFYVDTTANSEQAYNDEFKINVLDISDGIVSLETYKQKYERVWVTNVAKTTLGIGDSIKDGGYTLRLDDVTENGAKVVVESKGDSAEGTYLSGDHRKFSDEFMLHVIYVNKNNRELIVETLRPGAPEIRIDILTDKSIYDSGENIEYRFMLTNNGTIPINGLVLTTSSSGGNVNEPKMQHSGLEPTKAKVFTIPVSAPVTPVAKKISILSEVTGYDYRGNAYSGEGQVEVLVGPYLSVEKTVEIIEKPANEIDFGTDEYFSISISLKNTASFPTAVTVRDELDPSLIPHDMENTEWAVLVEPGSVKRITYYAKPTTPGNFTFPNTVAQWKDNGETYTTESDPIDVVFLIHGSKITVEKYLSPNYALPGEEIDVTISVVNAGNREVDAILSDDIPEQFSLVSGKNNWEGTLDAGESKEISYTLVTEETGQLRLPSATVDFTDENGQQGSSTSEEPVLYVDDDMTVNDRPEESYEEITYEEDAVTYTEPAPESVNPQLGRVEAAGFMVSSFITLFCILAIIPTIAYLYMNRIYK